MAYEQYLLVLGGAILGALIQPLWTNRLSPKSKLSATVTQRPFRVNSYLIKSISEYEELRWNSNIRFKPNKETIEKLRFSTKRGTFIEVTIFNDSTNTVENVAVHLKDGDYFCADIQMNGANSSDFFGKDLVLGDLRPQMRCNIEIWAPGTFLSNFTGPDKDLVRISAKKYDKISVYTPLPSYITERYLLLRKSYLFFGFIFLILASWILISLIEVTANAT